MDDDLRITVGSVTMHGRPGIGPFVVAKGGLDGWDDGVALRANDQPRPNQPGSHSIKRDPGTRTVRIDGHVLGRSLRDVRDSGLRLSGLGASGDPVRLQVDRAGSVQWCDAFVENAPVNPRPHEVRSDFQLQLWCPDPRKFGEQRKFVASPGSDATAYHRGNYPAKPVVTISGSMPGGYRLGVGGLAFVITRPLLSGTPHVVDYNTGRLRINGLVVHGNITESFTPGIQPGTPTVVSLTATTTGAGSASFAVTDTFI